MSELVYHPDFPLSYNPETGDFTWTRKTGKMREGSQAGSLNKSLGYVTIKYKRKLYYCHRLAHLFMTGDWPEKTVDHKDEDKANNKWSNLRPATNGQNMMNLSKLNRDNTSGFKGVWLDKARNKWVAEVAGKYRGRFDTPEEAYEAYTQGAMQHAGDFYNPGLRTCE